jgi:phenylalanyl-tRNA synthetase alpha chain
MVHLSPAELERDLAARDLTDPSEGHHAIQLLIDLAVDALTDTWGIPTRLCRGPRVVPIVDNYDHLNFTADAASRDARYTRYVDAERMLRSHASSMIPPALRTLAADPVDDVLLVAPGIVHRRDAIDRVHTGMPHQLDLWRISSGGSRELGNPDMDEMCQLLVDALAPGLEWRSEPRVHPYTLDGRQIDVLAADGEWIEVWECGLAHPDVLAAAGLDGWSGLALGMGLDRFLMLRKGIPDIRLLRATDRRIADQMADLEPYRTVSSMPPVSRDLSVAGDADDDIEQIGGRVRDALGDDAVAVEEVARLSETPYDDLPIAAIDRMGMSPGQRNLLVRVVLRHPERTLTASEANEIRDRVYAAIHRGTSLEWSP